MVIPFYGVIMHLVSNSPSLRLQQRQLVHHRDVSFFEILARGVSSLGAVNDIVCDAAMAIETRDEVT